MSTRGIAAAFAAAWVGAIAVWACVGSDPDPSSAHPAGADGATGSEGSANPGDDGSSGPSGPCVANTKRCVGVTLLLCNPEGTQEVEQARCETPELCNAGTTTACAAPACAAGETRCTGAGFERCNVGRTAFEKLYTCASSALCIGDAGADATPDAACKPPACPSAGYNTCAGGPTCINLGGLSGADCVITCKPDLTGYTFGQQCSAPPCNGSQDCCSDNGMGTANCL